MQDIHLVGGQFIESIGKSIEEVSPNPLVDNVTLLDAADGIVLIVFLIIFMMVFGVINYYFQRVMFYFLRKWIMRMDPHEAFEWPTPDCTDEGVPVFHKVSFMRRILPAGNPREDPWGWGSSLLGILPRILAVEILEGSSLL
jgi:hypothetical protein